jgi:hypothetical protein
MLDGGFCCNGEKRMPSWLSDDCSNLLHMFHSRQFSFFARLHEEPLSVVGGGSVAVQRTPSRRVYLPLSVLVLSVGGPFDERVKSFCALRCILCRYIGAGVGACYRGDELYDTPEVMKMVQKWTTVWSRYRTILTQDIVHVKRPGNVASCILA